MTKKEALRRLEGHTQYFVPEEDLEALEIAMNVLREQKEETYPVIILEEVEYKVGLFDRIKNFVEKIGLGYYRRER